MKTKWRKFGLKHTKHQVFFIIKCFSVFSFSWSNTNNKQRKISLFFPLKIRINFQSYPKSVEKEILSSFFSLSFLVINTCFHRYKHIIFQSVCIAYWLKQRQQKKGQHHHFEIINVGDFDDNDDDDEKGKKKRCITLSNSNN